MKKIIYLILYTFLGFPVIALAFVWFFTWHIFVAGFLFDVNSWESDSILMYGVLAVLISIIWPAMSLAHWADNRGLGSENEIEDFGQLSKKQ